MVLEKKCCLEDFALFIENVKLIIVSCNFVSGILVLPAEFSQSAFFQKNFFLKFFFWNFFLNFFFENLIAIGKGIGIYKGGSGGRRGSSSRGKV